MTKSLRNIEASINEVDPFIDCKLDRKKYAENLTSIIRNYPTGFVLALNNRWGDGKTFFVNRWRHLLKKEEFQTIYYNAWKDDFADNALLSIIAELTEDIEKPDEKLLETLLEKGTSLFARSLPILLKAAVKKGLGKDGFEEIAELLGDQVGGSFKKLIDEHKKQKKTISEFKEALKTFTQDAGKGKPIVFFIDELDRCKPSYAVEVLEVIKHFFDVDNIVFVLSIDKEQLANSVKGYYGSDNIDGDEYLKRFIDIEFSLPTFDAKKAVSYYLDYYDFGSFFNARTNNAASHRDRDEFERYAIRLTTSQNLNLRTIEKIFAQLRITLHVFELDTFLFPSSLLYLVFLFKEEKMLYNQIKNQKINIFDLMATHKNHLEADKLTKDSREFSFLCYTEIDLMQLYDNYLPSQIFKRTDFKFEDELSKTSMSPETFLLNIRAEHRNYRMAQISLSYLLDKIEFTNNLTII